MLLACTARNVAREEAVRSTGRTTCTVCSTNRGPIWPICFWSEAAGRFVKTAGTVTCNRAEARRIAEGMLKREVVSDGEDPVLLQYRRDFLTADSA